MSNDSNAATSEAAATTTSTKSMGDLFPDLGPEAPVISGVAHDRSEALATVRGVPNEPGMAAKVFTELAQAGVNVDMIVQAGASVGTADISFTVPESTVKQVETVLIDKHDELGYRAFDINTNVGKVAVVGVGMKTHSGLAAKFFTALSEKGINVLMISTSEIRIAALVPLEQLNDAVRALHTAYGLDSDQIEAVVYGGTGR
ncbi:aspartate kinase [Bifidobacterium leontopitheci]|uniref:aspartate kinase n=2 Tax=Bifidobacterium leontopitheci TaxID=2650774 RepID=A0A6I1GE93_9BIFI|nr:aspartate kinase [Bifidobacterium leontopitheci]